jgi:hypothetical protein
VSRRKRRHIGLVQGELGPVHSSRVRSFRAIQTLRFRGLPSGCVICREGWPQLREIQGNLEMLQKPGGDSHGNVENLRTREIFACLIRYVCSSVATLVSARLCAPSILYRWALSRRSSRNAVSAVWRCRNSTFCQTNSPPSIPAVIMLPHTHRRLHLAVVAVAMQSILGLCLSP